MKRSVHVSLTVVAAIGLASCGRRGPDPCAAQTFNELACQEAVNGGGYYYNNTWYPLRYSHPYPYYYDSYRGYVAHGGAVHAEPGVHYGRPASGVSRGGFGATGEGHASGHGSSGGHGAGE